MVEPRRCAVRMVASRPGMPPVAGEPGCPGRSRGGGRERARCRVSSAVGGWPFCSEIGVLAFGPVTERNPVVLPGYLCSPEYSRRVRRTATPRVYRDLLVESRVIPRGSGVVATDVVYPVNPEEYPE